MREESLDSTSWWTASEKRRARGRVGWAVTLWWLLVWLLPGLVLALERGTPVRIGVLTTSWGPPPGVVGLVEGLGALGYRENEDFVIGVRFTQGDTSMLPTVARELVQDGVDIIFCGGELAAKAAQQVTSTHPIVFMGVDDPIGQRFIASYARPGGNMTGVADLDRVLSAKRLELFTELIPGLKRVLFPYNGNDAYQAAKVRQYRAAAQQLGIVLVEQKLRTVEEARDVLARVRQEDVDGILAPRAPALNIPGFVLEATTRQGIPSMFGGAFYLKDGGLASYGPSWFASGRQAARLVDKIIKGADPGQIPVEVDHYFEFVINLKVAKALGLTIPREVLYQADRLLR